MDRNDRGFPALFEAAMRIWKPLHYGTVPPTPGSQRIIETTVTDRFLVR